MEGPLYKIIVMLFFNVSRRKHLDSVGSRDRLVVIQQRASCSSFLISKGAVHTGSAHRCSVHRSGVHRNGVYGISAHRSGVHRNDVYRISVQRSGVHRSNVL